MVKLVGSRYSNDNRVSRIRGPADRLNRAFLSATYSSPSEGVAMDWKTMLAYISGSVSPICLFRDCETFRYIASAVQGA